MKIVHRVLRVLVVAVLVTSGFLARAEAATIVSINPASQSVNVGDPVTADILVSGLTEPAGAFALVLNFDPAILSGNTYVNDPDAKMGASPVDLSGGFSGGSLDLYFSADLGLTQPQLAALEGTGFRLATVTFNAIAAGISSLQLTNVVLSDFSGGRSLPSGAVNGQVCVGAPCPAPEPGTLALLGAGAAALVARRRRAQTRA